MDEAAAGGGGGRDESFVVGGDGVCVCVCRGGVYTNSGNSLHKPVHSKDVPFNLH